MDAAAANIPPELVEEILLKLPPELVEEILLKLPLKSVLRFSSVSKTWNSMIVGSEFVKRYRSRAVMVLKRGRVGIPRNSLICPLSSENPSRDAKALVFPFKGEPYLHAWCDELWCVQVGDSLCLWNPSTRSCGKLPDPSLAPWAPSDMSEFSYGLGYDSADDDYKILKIHRSGETELYSLRSNTWRKIESVLSTDGHGVAVKNFSRVIGYLDSLIVSYREWKFRDYNLKMGVFSGGALHWIVVTLDEQVALISFDLSTEKYGEMGLPEFGRGCIVEMTVLMGKLSLCLNYNRSGRFVFWMMEESWTKKLDIDNFHRDLCFGGRYPLLRPFHLYENGEFLIHVFTDVALVADLLGATVVGEEWHNNSKIFVYNKDTQTLVKKDFRCSKIIDSFVYVENLVSLAKLEKMQNNKFEMREYIEPELLMGVGIVMVLSEWLLFLRRRR